MDVESLTGAAWATYLNAGGRLLGMPGTPLEHLGTDYIAAWIRVAKRVGELVAAEAEIQAKMLARELAQIFYDRIAGGEVVFKDFTKQPLAEQVAWEAVGRQLFQLATQDDDDEEEVQPPSWSEWAKMELKKRGSNAGSLQNA